MNKETAIKVGIVGVLGFLVAPYVYVAVSGIIGLALAAFIAFGAVMLAPYVAMKLANVKTKAVMHEASKNPIETLLNQYAERADALKRFSRDIASFAAQIETFRTQLATFTSKYPQRAGSFQQQLQQMEALKARRKHEYDAAKEALERFRLTIDEARAVWDMSQAASQLADSAGMEIDVMEEIKAKTALESVQKSMGEAFGQLEMAMLEAPEETIVIDQSGRLVGREKVRA